MSHFTNVSILLALLVHCSQSFMIEFYKSENYTNFINEFDINGKSELECHNIAGSGDVPEGFEVGSIKTEKCLMVYPNRDCKRPDPVEKSGQPLTDWAIPLAYAESFRVDRNVPVLLRHLGELITMPRFAQSFHVCSQERGGGPSVDVDFYQEPDYNGKVIASFQDVCICKNLPGYLKFGHSTQGSIDNHGNTIELFENEQCTGNSRSLNAGHSWDSRHVWNTYTTDNTTDAPENGIFDVKSIRPSGSVNCIKLEASIHKFTFKNGTGFEEGNLCKLTKNVKIAADTILRAKGNAKLVQEFTISEKVSETLDVTVSTSYSNMHTVKVEASFEAEVKGGVPFVAEGTARTKFGASYEYKRTDGGSTSNRTSVTKEGTISARQNIEIQPCNECRISSYMKQVQHFPIEYEAFAKVTGTAAGRRLTTKEIRTYLLPGVKYSGDIDEYTVDTIVQDVMYADFGMSAFIDAECTYIPGCSTAANSKVGGPINFKKELQITKILGVV